MKEVKHYICEICGTEFNDSSKAEKCERGHSSCKKIVDEAFHSVTADASGYPLEITVEMSDGKLVIYKRTKRLA